VGVAAQQHRAEVVAEQHNIKSSNSNTNSKS